MKNALIARTSLRTWKQENVHINCCARYIYEETDYQGAARPLYFETPQANIVYNGLFPIRRTLCLLHPRPPGLHKWSIAGSKFNISFP